MTFFENKKNFFVFLFSLTIILAGFAYGNQIAIADEDVPNWVKVVAGAWADGLISTEEFLNAINFLISNDIIKVPGYVFLEDIKCEDICEFPQDVEMMCNDGKDNDGDGFTDCQDFDCDDNNACTDELLCTQVYDPVCGEDGNTYGNECYATKASVEVAYQGQCQEEPEVMCTQVYDPVCGEDGNTYGNECEALKEGVEVAYKGLCRAR